MPALNFYVNYRFSPGVAFGVGVGDGLGIAIAPIRGRGVGVAKGLGIFVTRPPYLFRNVRAVRPPTKARSIEKTAVAATDNLCFTFAQPTGQSAVSTVPSFR